MASNASRTIKSAHRVLEILEYFDQDRRHATVMGVSRALKYPQSSTSELLRCLTHLGYLHYNRFRRTYSPTARVALLGAWVKPSLFRGGPLISVMDEIGETTRETVLLSTTANYVLQHIHVLQGSSGNAIHIHGGGDTRSVLHSPQGRLLLSSYRSDHVRLAVHRLNADETDPERRVKASEIMDELAALREQGWIIAQEANGTGSVAVLLPYHSYMDRLALSVQARSEVIEEQGEEILSLLQHCRDQLETMNMDGDKMERRAGHAAHFPDLSGLMGSYPHYA